MPEFIVVKCCDCAVFQVAQVRKDKKFNCKMCTKKQSVIKVYNRSSRAADCRKVVQQLNMARGTAAEEYEALEQQHDEIDSSYKVPGNRVEPEQSKWATYVRHDQLEDTDMGDDVDDMHTTTLPDWSTGRTKRNRKRPRNNTNSGNDNYNSHGAKRRSRKAVAGDVYTQQDQYRHQQYQQHYQQPNPHDESMRPEFTTRSDPRNHPDSNDASDGNRNNNKSGGYIVDDGFLTSMGGDEAFKEEVYP